MTVVLRRKDLLQHGEPRTISMVDETDPGNTIELLNETYIDKEYLTQLFVSCGEGGKIEVILIRPSLPDKLIASGRIDAQKQNFDYSWAPVQPIEAGESVKITFFAFADRPIANIEAQLQSAKP